MMSHAAAIDRLRTMFAEQWDGAADFLDAINDILDDTRGALYVRADDTQGATWRDAERAWLYVYNAKHPRRGSDVPTVPARAAVIKRMRGMIAADKNGGRHGR